MLCNVFLNSESVDKALKFSYENYSTISTILPCGLFVLPYKVVVAFEPMDEILKCGHSNESY